MTTTAKQKALWANSVVRDCLLEAGDDVDTALMAADYILSTNPVPEEVEEPELIGTADGKPVDLNAFFSYDIHNKKAQGILNRSLEAAKILGVSAKKELQVALKKDPRGNGEAILKWLDRYRLRLAKLLTTSQLASLLEGATEVATDIPVLATFPGAVPTPPSLEPKEAVTLVSKLAKMAVEERAELIYELPVDQQGYVQQAIAAKEAGGPIVPPPFEAPVPPLDAPEGVHFPTIDEAVKHLSEKNVMSRPQFDALDAAARAKAFTVANVNAEETLTKIRDVLAENVEEGASYKTFVDKIMDEVDTGTFMSPWHMETVFRTNIQGAFSDGQMTVLNNPLVRSGFPYARQDAIHDNRVEDTHLEVEKIGISGTNVFRINDPVFQTFRAPWRYNCRCGWTPMTVRQAAEEGITEAQEWLETGVEPSPPAFVKMPDFRPPPGFQRAITSMPLSIQLSLSPMKDFGTRPEKAGPPLEVGEDGYPRDKSNRFLDKHIIAEAAQNLEKLTALRGSIPEEQRWKLDRAVDHLKWGGTIYHPREQAGLAIDIHGTIADSDWRWYSRDLERVKEYKKREEDRTNRRKNVDEFVKAIRNTKPATKLYKTLIEISKRGVDLADKEMRGEIIAALDEYFTHLDEIDTSLKSSGASSAEIRSVDKLRHQVETQIDKRISTVDLFHVFIKEVQDACGSIDCLYESIAECIYTKIDQETEQAYKPEEPKEPADTAGEFRALALDAHGIDHQGKGRPTGGRFTPRGIDDTDLSEGRQPGGSASGAGLQQPDASGQGMEGAPGGPGIPRTSEGGTDTGEQPGDGPRPSIRTTPAPVAAAIERLDKIAQWAGRTGKSYITNWLGDIRQHVEKFGTEEALKQMGGSGLEQGQREPIAYDPGEDYPKDWGESVRSYLNHYGIYSYYDPEREHKSAIADLYNHGLRPLKDETGKLIGVRDNDRDTLYRFGTSDYESFLEEAREMDMQAAKTAQTRSGWNVYDTSTGTRLSAIKQLEDFANEKKHPKVISSITPKAREELEPRPEGTEVAFEPAESKITDKLTEAKRLPGLESSEDVSVLMGKPTTHINDEVISKLDEKYGKDQWIVKPYTEDAFAGQSIHFATKIAKERSDAKNALWEGERQLGKVGYSYLKDDTGKVVGLQGAYNDVYNFGTPEYSNLAQRASKTSSLMGRMVAGLEENVNTFYDGVALKNDEDQVVAKGFMAQPAFPALAEDVGKRASGHPYAHTEARAHILTKNGQANLVPYTTFYKKRPFPIIFQDDDSKEIERVAQEAVMRVPEDQRQGHVYAPDIIKTADGYKVVELNPSNEIGSSGHLGSNPLIIDAYVSHIQGREPGFAQFIKRVLTKKNKVS